MSFEFLAGESASIAGLIFLNDDSVVIGNLFEVVNCFKSVVTAGTLLAFGMNISSRGVNKDASTTVGVDSGSTLDSYPLIFLPRVEQMK